MTVIACVLLIIEQKEQQTNNFKNPPICSIAQEYSQSPRTTVTTNIKQGYQYDIYKDLQPSS